MNIPLDPTIVWQFSYPKNPDIVSKLIKEKMGSEISHVDVFVPTTLSPDGMAKWLGAHSDTGVQLRDLNYMEFGLAIQVTVHVSAEQYQDFWKYILARVGDQYNKAGIVGIIFDRALKEEGHEFCSEVQADAIKAAKILNIRKESCMIDPEQLRLIVSSPIDATEVRITR
jgi:hypothetical protein